MDLGLKDRVYIVTGATRGLGNAVARELAGLSDALARRYFALLPQARALGLEGGFGFIGREAK